MQTNEPTRGTAARRGHGRFASVSTAAAGTQRRREKRPSKDSGLPPKILSARTGRFKRQLDRAQGQQPIRIGVDRERRGGHRSHQRRGGGNVPRIPQGAEASAADHTAGSRQVGWDVAIVREDDWLAVENRRVAVSAEPAIARDGLVDDPEHGGAAEAEAN